MQQIQTRPLADRDVAAIGLGCARWSLSDHPDDAEALRGLDGALDLGFNYLDTALAYTTPIHDSHNESIIAHLLRRRSIPADVLVATKGGHTRTGAGWGVDGRPETLKANCETSLRTLRVEAIDLYYLHFPDPNVPIEDSVGALDDLRTAGKIRSIGVSNVDAHQVRAAQAVAPLAAVQNSFSPYNHHDRDVLRYCETEGIAFVAYSPLGGTSRPTSLERLSPSAAAAGLTLGESTETVLLAWLLTQSRALIPLTGARRSASIAASWRATSLTLHPEILTAINADLEATP